MLLSCALGNQCDRRLRARPQLCTYFSPLYSRERDTNSLLMNKHDCLLKFCKLYLLSHRFIGMARPYLDPRLGLVSLNGKTVTL